METDGTTDMCYALLAQLSLQPILADYIDLLILGKLHH
jgi:hypothetical protein